MTDHDNATSSSSNTPTSTRAKSRKTRVYAFREFLLETYGNYLGKETKSSNPLILDVAGGKGDLSWLFCNVDGIASVVLDPVGSVPRCAIPKSVNYLREHPEQGAARSVKGLPTYQPLAPLIAKLEGKDEFVTPPHLDVCLDQEFVQRIRCVVGKEGNADEEWSEFWSSRLREREGKNSKGNSQQRADTAITEADTALQTILDIELVVGFHPDQATDYCIELANLLHIPWCIVPCCVFPAEFPHRRLQNGDRVRDYQQLIVYLREQHPEAKTGYLEFSFTETAKNLVLYTTPADSNKRARAA